MVFGTWSMPKYPQSLFAPSLTEQVVKEWVILGNPTIAATKNRQRFALFLKVLPIIFKLIVQKKANSLF